MRADRPVCVGVWGCAPAGERESFYVSFGYVGVHLSNGGCAEVALKTTRTFKRYG